MSIEILQEPRVYLVGRPSLNLSGFQQFFDDEGVHFSIQGQPVTQDPSRDRQWNINTDKAAEVLAMCAGKICYDAYAKGRSEIEPYLSNIIESKHGSILEHANWNFIIAGVSRVFSHEHVRHRAGCAISQRSQRYVRESESGQILLPMIANNPEAKAIWEQAVQQSQTAYDQLVEILVADLKNTVSDSTLRTKIVRSAARSVMPNSTETYIFWTANARALRHYIELRASEHADYEIRRVAIQLLNIMREEAPAMFSDFKVIELSDGTQAVETANHKI